MKYLTIYIVFLAFLIESNCGAFISKKMESESQKSPSPNGLASAVAFGQEIFDRARGMGMGMGMGGPEPAPGMGMGMGMGSVPCVPNANVTDISSHDATHGNSLSIYSCDGSQLLTVVPAGALDYPICLPFDGSYSFVVGGGQSLPLIGFSVTDVLGSQYAFSSLSTSFSPYSEKSRTCSNCPSSTDAALIQSFFEPGTINSLSFFDCQDNLIATRSLTNYNTVASNFVGEIFSFCVPQNGIIIRSDSPATYTLLIYDYSSEMILFGSSSETGVVIGGCEV